MAEHRAAIGSTLDHPDRTVKAIGQIDRVVLQAIQLRQIPSDSTDPRLHLLGLAPDLLQHPLA
jgi:hypothetical protein